MPTTPPPHTDAPAGWTGLVAVADLAPDVLERLEAALPGDLAPVVDPPVPAGPMPMAAVDEPLVVADAAVACGHAYRRRGLPGVAERTWLRAGTLERVVAADAALPPGFSLHVLDGWRSLETQRALFDEVYFPGSTLPPGFVADPDDRITPPPHTTGAAVDLTLAFESVPLALGTDFDDFDDRAHLAALEAPGGSEPERVLRRLLWSTVTGAGLCPLPEEWWHVSFGDDRWAHWSGVGRARYRPTEPPGAWRVATDGPHEG